VGQALQTRAQIDVESVIKARLGCRHAVLQASLKQLFRHMRVEKVGKWRNPIQKDRGNTEKKVE
jgi:hypothetical protein